jgi:capsular polysaccharide export protein
MSSASRRVFLFLQGPPSTFFVELADELMRRGERVVRVNLAAGDRLYWRRPGAINYRGSFAEWRGFVDALIAREGVTDVLFYADRYPYHRVAGAVARARSARVTAVEFGYLRPDWITFERDGMGIYSHFPDDAGAILAAAAALPEPDATVRYRYPFRTEAFHEVVYNLAQVFAPYLHPRYRSSAYYHPIHDYLSWVPKLALAPFKERGARATVERLVGGTTPYFVLPMQLQSDYQIQDNSPFDDLGAVIRKVTISFAEHAPKAARLVVKIHPLDPGIEAWPRVARIVARELGLSDRVDVIDGGDLYRLLGKAEGCVVVNSTVGLHALRLDCPVAVLGVAVFDVPGLTFQGDLDAFWTQAERPDPALRDAFVRLLAAATQVKGCFYTPEGRAAAIAEAADRLLTHRVNEPGAYVDPPPRLARARRLGMDARVDDAADLPPDLLR